MSPTASTEEIWLVQFDDPGHAGEPGSLRPALVVGPVAGWGGSLPFVIVVPFTTTGRGLVGLHVEVEPDAQNGLTATSYVQCELIRSVSRNRLRHRLGRLDLGSIADVETIIRDLLGW